MSHDPNFPNVSSVSGLDDLLESPFNSKRLISRIHDCIASLKTITIAKIRADWADELGEDMEDDMWNCALLRVNDSTSCAKLSIIQFKVLHRTHFSKARLAKIYPDSDASCNRCHHTPANLTHMFWSCPALVTYWSMIFKTLSEALNTDFQPNAAAAIFGITDRRHSIVRKSYKNILAFVTLLARRRILLHWKSKNPPKASLWMCDLMHFIQLEKIKYSLRGSRDKFYSTWDPVLKYIGKLKTIPDTP